MIFDSRRAKWAAKVAEVDHFDLNFLKLIGETHTLSIACGPSTGKSLHVSFELMRSFLGREVRHYYLELTNRCFLACSACARTPIRGTLTLGDLPIEIVEKIILEHAQDERSLLSFSLSGVFGDPIYHPQFLNVIELIKRHDASVNIVTNGAYREEAWWQQLALLLDAQDEITFSIDGLKNVHEIYRKFGNFDQSFRALQVMRSSEAHIIWKYIVFPHNKDDVEKARELAEKMGVEFNLFQTDRTNNREDFIQEGEEWKPPRLKRKEIAKKILKKITDTDDLNMFLRIEPQCVSGKEPTFVSHKGEVLPCCRPSADFYDENSRPDAAPFADLASEWNLGEKSLEEVFAHPFFKDFIHNITTKVQSAPYICQKNCSVVTPAGLNFLGLSQ